MAASSRASRAAFSHRDLRIIHPDAGDSLFRASCFDNEGHVIQHRVVAPAPGGRAVFESEAAGAGPRFRLASGARSRRRLRAESGSGAPAPQPRGRSKRTVSFRRQQLRP